MIVQRIDAGARITISLCTMISIILGPGGGLKNCVNERIHKTLGMSCTSEWVDGWVCESRIRWSEQQQVTDKSWLTDIMLEWLIDLLSVSVSERVNEWVCESLIRWSEQQQVTDKSWLTDIMLEWLIDLLSVSVSERVNEWVCMSVNEWKRDLELMADSRIIVMWIWRIQL